MSDAEDSGLTDKKNHRLFFALCPDTPVRQLIMNTREEYFPRQGKFVDKDNLHLTLAFPGQSTQKEMDCYIQAATQVRSAPFILTLDNIGCFQRARVLWMGCKQVPEGLLNLVEILNGELSACAYQPEDRAFKPHVTLARKYQTVPVNTQAFSICWYVKSFSLMQSVSSVNGVQYQSLQTWALTG